MPKLSNLPFEILLRVYEHCDGFSQAVSLASTGRRCRSVWETKMPTIIWHVGMTSIARATAIVLEDIQKARLPPHAFPFASLSGNTRQPSLAELKSIFDLENLVKCIEEIQLHHTDWSSENDLEFMEGPGIWTIWRNRLHRSLYRLFLTSAALAGVYQEPFLNQRDNCPPTFLAEYLQEGTEAAHMQNFDSTITTQDLGYLLQFPVYNFEAFDQHDAAYGPLAGFLLETSRQRAGREDIDDLPLTEFLSEFLPRETLDLRQAKVLFTETTQLLAASVCLKEHINNHGSLTDEIILSGGTANEMLRTVSFVNFDSFFPLEVEVPIDVEKTPSSGLICKDTHVEKPSNVHYLGPLDFILPIVYLDSGQPNSYGPHCPAPSPPLQFFQYIYRKYLGIRISKAAFEPSKYGPHLNWAHNANVFSDRFSTWADDLEGFFAPNTAFETSYHPR